MNNIVLFCKTYKNDFERFRILKNSIDKFNIENIPFYVVCPEEDKKLFEKLFLGNEKYKNFIITDEKIFELLKTEKQEQNWNIQGIIKFGFYKLNVCNFFLIIDSDSYFIRDFKISDFMYDQDTPYIVMHENKHFKEVCSILGTKNISEMENIVKKYYNRKGKDYKYLTTPIVFSSKVLENLEKKEGDFKKILELSPIEASWHGEFLLNSNIINFKPCEPFFKCFNYEFEYNFWKKIGETNHDISNNYFGIVMQNRWIKSNIFKNSFLTFFNRKINRLSYFVNLDRGHLKHNFKFYKDLIKDFIKEIFKEV